jgi:hypothetical protein
MSTTETTLAEIQTIVASIDKAEASVCPYYWQLGDLLVKAYAAHGWMIKGSGKSDSPAYAIIGKDRFYRACKLKRAFPDGIPADKAHLGLAALLKSIPTKAHKSKGKKATIQQQIEKRVDSFVKDLGGVDAAFNAILKKYREAHPDDKRFLSWSDVNELPQEPQDAAPATPATEAKPKTTRKRKETVEA